MLASDEFGKVWVEAVVARRHHDDVSMEEMTENKECSAEVVCFPGGNRIVPHRWYTSDTILARPTFVCSIGRH
jgi:hypothetical protein